MGSVNRVILVGRLGADPEIRRTAEGKAIANLRLATSESWRDKASGEKRERTEWHRVVIFNEGLAKVVDQYAKKGSQLYVCGQLQTRKWQDKDGADKWTTEVVIQSFGGELQLLDSKPSNGSREEVDDSIPASQPTSKRASMKDEMDDEIPFAPEFR